jgi:hypothetical protein
VLALWLFVLATGAGTPAFAGAKTARAVPDVFERPPKGCTLGIAGPTLDPATALHVARDGAFAAMAAQRLGVELTSELSWVGTRVRERAQERTAGTLHGAWIAALRPRPGGGLDAIACGAEVVAWPRGQDRSGNRWPPAFGRSSRCAIGVAGPGLGPGDQARLAWRDAREMLARSVEMRIERELELDAGIRVQRRHSVSATSVAQRLIEEADASLARRRWLDRRGRGPLRQPGLLYVELCLPQTK